ncbi:putative nuclear transcription factor Y subunit A-9-like isoform 1 [Capsicum annuum]|nr:putative nuclear transcription factor Y subunit A-9-like isoform 1 [Capsicum annuum]
MVLGEVLHYVFGTSKMRPKDMLPDKEMDFGPNSISKASSRGEDCPRQYKETKDPLTHRCGTPTVTGIICSFKREIVMLFSKQAAQKDVFQLFAEKVRDHKDLVSRWAVLQETRVEYFRGKDFVSFVRNHLELKDVLESDRSLEAEDIANILLKKSLLVRCDRVVKTVRPGKKKLSTFPAHLEIYHYGGHSQLIPNILIPNRIAPSMSAHPSQHPYFRNLHLLNMRTFDWPTLYFIQQTV